MSIRKDCADHLRANYLNATGNRMKSGHAHEIVAAYFGYGTGAALRAEKTYPLDALPSAAIIVPDVKRIEERLPELDAFPANAGNADSLAAEITAFLIDEDLVTGEIWDTRDLKDYFESEYVPENASRIMDQLSSEMAETNAFFDGPDIDEVDIDEGPDGLGVTVSGVLSGDSDPDRAYYGHVINFLSFVRLDLVAGRNAYAKPDWETSGEVDQSDYGE